MTLSGVVLDSPDARALAAFYRDLLGWAVRDDEPGWVVLTAPSGQTNLSFQTENAYVRPVWPSGRGQPQMMLHLDFKVDDLEAATAYAQRIGAVLADYQPQDDVRVLLDPAGHPFCLWIDA
jgi:catechol 2,3-dioxygenase-like lactoylglutathione lyase family enzyme